MVELVETMMTADSLRPTAYGPDGIEMRIAKDLPKAKTAQLWGLTAADLVEIQKNLKELTE